MIHQNENPECAARDESLERVVANAGDDWRARALDVISRMPNGEVTGEDIRLACLDAGVEPHHHNAWGGVIAGLVRSGQLIDTGRRRAMRASGSHARKTPIYEIAVRVTQATEFATRSGLCGERQKELF